MRSGDRHGLPVASLSIILGPAIARDTMGVGHDRQREGRRRDVWEDRRVNHMDPIPCARPAESIGPELVSARPDAGSFRRSGSSSHRPRTRRYGRTGHRSRYPSGADETREPRPASSRCHANGPSRARWKAMESGTFGGPNRRRVQATPTTADSRAPPRGGGGADPLDGRRGCPEGRREASLERGIVRVEVKERKIQFAPGANQHVELVERELRFQLGVRGWPGH